MKPLIFNGVLRKGGTQIPYPKLRKVKKLLLLVVIALFLIPVFQGASVEYSPGSTGIDTYLDDGFPGSGSNFGATQSLIIGASLTNLRRSLVAINWTDLGFASHNVSSVDKVTMMINVSGKGAHTEALANISVYQMFTCWEEGVEDDLDGYANWDYNSSGGRNWLGGQEGTDFNATVMNSTNISSTNTYYNFSLTPSVMDSQLRGDNCGVMLKYVYGESCGGAESCTITFESSDSLTPITFFIDYTVKTALDECTEIHTPGDYTLASDIIDSSESICIDISSNNISLDCQGHTVDGDGELGSNYGIRVYRASPQDANITIKNCVVTDWLSDGIHIENANSTSLINITANSNNKGVGLYSSFCTLLNVTAESNTYGVWLHSDFNNLTNVSVSSNTYGIHLDGSDSNIFSNITANANSYGFQIGDTISCDLNIIRDSRIENSTTYGISFYLSAQNDSNNIYNNFFNNTVNVGFTGTVYNNTWNTSKTASTNIIGGSYLGGNYWATPSGDGFSETCVDGNSDGICEEAYTLGTDNVDYLPLTSKGFWNCTTISSSGDYALTSDITDSSASICIDISANNVNLDCAGHTIDGIDAGSGIRVYRASSEDVNVTVRNCVVTDWNEGISVSVVNSTSLINITASSNNYGVRLYGNSSALTNITANSNTYGFDVGKAYFNNFTNITLTSNTYGVLMDDAHNNSFVNVSANANTYGFQIGNTASCDDNTIKDSRIENSTTYGISFYLSAQNSPNKIYNNLFNNTANVVFSGTIYNNTWNTSKQVGIRIYSNGTEIGGNYWTNASGTGYSDTCTDADYDGFCDNAYTLGTDNIDYLPLSGAYNGTRPYWDSVTNTASTTTRTGGNWSVGVNLRGDLLDFAYLTVNGTDNLFHNLTLVDLGDVTSVTLNETNITWSAEGEYVCGRYWFNDTHGGSNETDNSCFIVAESTSPTWINVYNNASTLTKTGFDVNWTANISDETGLSFAWLEHNGTNFDDAEPAIYNESIFALTGTNYNVSQQISINVTRANYTCGRFWFNDTVNNVNKTDWSCFVVANTVPTIPSTSPAKMNSTNSSEVLSCSGSTDSDSDDITYEFYINTTASPTTLHQNTTSTTYTFTPDVSNAYYWRCKAHDGFGASSYSADQEIYFDFMAPTWSDNSTNASTTTKYGGNVSFGVNLTDEMGLDSAFLEVNGSLDGGWRNYSAVVRLGGVKSVILNETNITWNTRDQTICGKYWFNDTLGNINESGITCFLIANTPPSVTAPSINDSSAKNLSVINCSDGVYIDADSDSEGLSLYAWFVNGVNVSSSQILDLDGVAMEGDVLNCSQRPYDGTDYGDWKNSSSVTVANTLPTILYQPHNITNASAGHWFTVLANASDLDGGADITFLAINVSAGSTVQIDNTTLGNYRGVKYNVSGTALTLISFNITFGDEVGDIVSGQMKNTFPNQLPTISNAVINDSTPTDSEDINCSVSGVADVDADATTVYYSWFVNGVDANNHTAVLYAGNLTTDDVWKCYAWVGDGYEFSSNVSSAEVSVGTSYVAPQISQADVTTTNTVIASDSINPTRNDSWINISVTFSDANTWEKWTMYACKNNDGTASGCGVGGIWCNSTLNSTDTVLMCNYTITSDETGFDVYTYVVDNGSLVSADNSTSRSSFVINHPPTIPVFSTASDIWTQTNSINLGFSASDEDSDSINYSLMWGTSLNPTELVWNGTSTAYNLSGMNESFYYVTVYAVDQHGYPSLANSTNLFLKFDWNKPNVTNVSVSSYSIYTTGEIDVRLNCSDSFSNVDNATIKYTVLNPNGEYKNYSMSNSSDNISDYIHTFKDDLLATAGTYYVINAFCDDVATNRNFTDMNISFTTTVYVPPTPPSGGNGGGGGGGYTPKCNETTEVWDTKLRKCVPRITINETLYNISLNVCFENLLEGCPAFISRPWIVKEFWSNDTATIRLRFEANKPLQDCDFFYNDTLFTDWNCKIIANTSVLVTIKQLKFDKLSWEINNRVRFLDTTEQTKYFGITLNIINPAGEIGIPLSEELTGRRRSIQIMTFLIVLILLAVTAFAVWKIRREAGLIKNA